MIICRIAIDWESGGIWAPKKNPKKSELKVLILRNAQKRKPGKKKKKFKAMQDCDDPRH